MIPVVSIIMPAYNAAKHIKQAIESVIAQDWKAWELIVVDDGSQDDTSRIVGEFAARNPQIALTTNKRVKGVAGARNTAITMAKGQFIAFLDADDVWRADKLTRQVTELTRSGSAFACSDYHVISDDGVQMGVRRVPSPCTYNTLLKSNRIGCLTAIYDQTYLGKVFMPEGLGHEDYLTWLEILNRTETVLVIQEPLAYYRLTKGSLSSMKRSAAKWQWHIYRKRLGLSLMESVWYFSHYAANGLVRKFRYSIGSLQK